MWIADVRVIMNNKAIQCQLWFTWLLLILWLDYVWAKCIGKALKIFQLLNSSRSITKNDPLAAFWITYKGAVSEWYTVKRKKTVIKKW